MLGAALKGWENQGEGGQKIVSKAVLCLCVLSRGTQKCYIGKSITMPCFYAVQCCKKGLSLLYSRAQCLMENFFQYILCTTTLCYNTRLHKFCVRLFSVKTRTHLHSTRNSIHQLNFGGVLVVKWLLSKPRIIDREWLLPLTDTERGY